MQDKVFNVVRCIKYNRFGMNRKLLVIPILLLLIVGIVPAVSSATSVKYDDTETFWTGNNGASTKSEDTSLMYYGTSCLKVVTTGTGGPEAVFSSQDWSSYSKFNIYFNVPLGKILAIRIYATNDVNYFTYTYTGTGNWDLESVALTSFSTGVGSPSWSTVTTIYCRTNEVMTFYIDRIWLSGSDTQTLIISDPVYATMSPTVGTHSDYVEGQPVEVTATLLANYTFLKYGWVASETTSNPGWVVMNGNYTLTTTLLAPAADDYGATETNAAWTSVITQISLFWLPFAVFALLSFWSIRMRGNYKYFGLVFPILGLTWAFAETSYPSALFYYVSATFFIFMLLFVGFKLAGLGNRNQRRWG